MANRWAWPSVVVVVGRAALLLVTVTAVVVGFAFRADEHAREHAGDSKGGVAYVCPMHPQVRAGAPGDCPICRMALEPERKVPPRSAPAGEKSPKITNESGADVAAVDEAGEPVLKLSHEDRLHAFDSVSRVKVYATSSEMRGPAWNESAVEGVALLRRDETLLLTAGESARFFPSARPRDGVAAGVPVHVTADAPTSWDGATALVRFRVDGSARLVAGQTGSIKLATRLRRGLVVRAPAILRSPEGPYVLVVSTDRRTLTKRRVEMGNVLYGYAAIVAGLNENEVVAAKRTFFLDAARRAGKVTGAVAVPRAASEVSL